MNCSPNISIALCMLSLTAGVWFLHKVQKENLGILYKIAAWSVIIITILNMACCGMRCCMQRGCGGERECRERMYGGECGRGGCDEGRSYHGGWGRGMDCCCKDMCRRSCDEGEGECRRGGDCDDEGEGKCCEKEGEGQCKKDTVDKMK